MDMNEFKPIAGYEDRYFVSTLGEIYSLKAKRLLKPMQTQKGYLKVELFKDYKRKVEKIHRLVAKTFIPNPNEYKEVNHINGDKKDNRVSNLEWCSRSENLRHSYKLGLHHSRKGIPRAVKTR